MTTGSRSTIKLLFGAFAACAVGFALLGSSASADALCEEDLQMVEEEEACLAPYPEATTVEGSAKEASFVSGEFKVTCNVSFVWKAEKDLEPGEGQEGQVTSVTFTSCKGSCSSAKATGLPYGALASGSKEGDGTVAWTGTGEKGPGVTFSGCSGSSCSYESEELAFSVDDGEPTHVTGKGLTMEKTSGSCPSSGSLAADYELQQPNAGVLAIAQDTAGILLSPFFPIIGLNQRADITILNTGTVGWRVNTLSLSNAVDFDLVDPLPGEEEACKNQFLARNESCKAGVKCKTLKSTTNLSVETGLGTFFDPVSCK